MEHDLGKFVFTTQRLKRPLIRRLRESTLTANGYIWWSLNNAFENPASSEPWRSLPDSLHRDLAWYEFR